MVPDRVLIVEDLDNTREWLSRMLSTAFPRAEVKTAACIEDAETLLVEYAPNLALVDLGLPDGEGITLFPLILQRVPDCLIVVSTIYDDESNVFPAFRAGASGYLLKDNPMAEQVELMRGITEGRPPLSPEIAAKMLAFFRGEGQKEVGETLTKREIEILKHIATGQSVSDVSESLHISANTVSTHIKSVYRKLNISSRAEAAIEAQRRGLL